MEFSISKKERRSSFWKYLPGFQKNKPKHDCPIDQDVTLISANKIYSSFRSLGKKTPKRTESPKEVGVMFLTSDNQLRWKNEESKHVQFAPTPMNKCHIYDKENVHPSKLEESSSVASILKHGPSIQRRAENLECLDDANCPLATPEKDVTTPEKWSTLPRTSTKTKLRERFNGTLTSFDISAIANDRDSTRSNSLGRLSHDGSIRMSDGLRHNRLSLPSMESQVSHDDIGVPHVTCIKPKGIEYVEKSIVRSAHHVSRSRSCRHRSTNDCSSRHNFCSPIKEEVLSPMEDGSSIGLGLRHSMRRSVTSSDVNTQQWYHFGAPEDIFNRPCQSRQFQQDANKNALPHKHIDYRSRCHCCYQTSQVLKEISVTSFRDNPHNLGEGKDLRQRRDKDYRLSFRSVGPHILKDGRRSKNAPITSSPTRGKLKPTLSHAAKKYDGMSSMADDENSLNCSCSNCFDDMAVGSKRPSRRQSFRDKLFFPELQPLPRNEPPIKTCTSKSTEQPKLNPNGYWYECNDAMCMSPTVIPPPNKGPLPSSDVVITEDYDFQKPIKESAEKTPETTQVISPCESAVNVCSPDLSPNSKKLGESCVIALQETLKSLLPDSEVQPVFTISSSEDMVATPNTIVIQIQNNSRRPPLKELDGQEGSSHSLPDVSKTNDEPVSNSKDDSTSSAEQAEQDMSGQKTPELASTTKTNDDSSGDKELLEEMIRIGKNLPPPLPPKQKKKVSLTVPSPRKQKFKAKDVLSGRAKLKLNIYRNGSMVTVHVIKAVKLTSVRTMVPNPYVKVSLFPDDSRRAHWRTNVVDESNNPEFNQKFSFEFMPEDSKKRLIFSVWHRDRERKRSEFLGCMSFGVYHVMDENQSLSGWYRLLKEVVGTRKHFASGKGNAISMLLAR